MYQTPVFFLSLNSKADENSGELVAGTIAWSGNFRFAFELDNKNSLRISSGINPFASEYSLQPGKIFTTPCFIYTFSCFLPKGVVPKFHRSGMRCGGASVPGGTGWHGVEIESVGTADLASACSADHLVQISRARSGAGGSDAAGICSVARRANSRK